MSDRLEELRHELADVETVLEELHDAEGGQDPDLVKRREALEEEIVALERAARVEAGADPEPEVLDADPADFRPAPAELVVPPVPPGTQDERYAVAVVLDKHDEDQILAAIEDRMDKVLLYDFTQGNKKLIDLSWKGVLEVIRQMNQTTRARVRIDKGSLEVQEVHEDTGSGAEWLYVATVAAIDEVSGLETIGTATEPKYQKRTSGPPVWDKFARTKAINKAQRNALGMHIPERLRQALIALHKGDEKRVLEVKHGAGAAAAAQLPPPVTTEAARALEERARVLWVEIKKLPGWRELMLPGVFNAKLSRARSSEAELESFVEALESMRAKLAGEG